MNPDPDYSAAYVILRTDAGDGLEGHGFTFTIGRGTEVVVAASDALAAARRRPRTGDRQRRHGRVLAASSSATASCAGSAPRRASSTSPRRRSSTRSGTCSRSGRGKPVWQLLVDMTPEEIVALVDFRYITDALTPERGARRSSRPLAARRGRARGGAAAGRLPRLHDLGRLARLRRRQDPAALPRGAGRGLDAVQAEGRRGRRGRRPAGADRARGDRPGRMLAVDANQRWDVDEAIEWMARAAPSSTRTGSRSRPAPTTSSATRRSRGPSRRSGSRPASTSTTG